MNTAREQAKCKQTRKPFKLILAIIGGILFALLLCVSIMGPKNISELYIKYNYARVSNYGIYMSYDSITRVSTVGDKIAVLPHNIRTMLKNWNIVVAKTSPFACPAIAAGATFYKTRTIWIGSENAEEVFLHEAGHAVDYHCGYVSKSQDFIDVYKKYWNKYTPFGNQEAKHSVCETSEFFAATFADYLLNTDYIANNYVEILNYFDALIYDKWPSFEIGDLARLWMRDYTTLTYTSLDDHVIDVTKNPFININNYSFASDYSYLPLHVQVVIEKVINSNFEQDEFVEQDLSWTKYDYTSLLSWLAMYYCDDNFEAIELVNNVDTTQLVIKHSLLKEANNKRLSILSDAETILSQLKDGSDVDKLIQISKYLTENMQPDATLSELTNNINVCMIFKQFADRLGIQNDIVYTMNRHVQVSKVYNRVFMNGVPYYYNLTINMVHSPNIDVIAYYEYDWKQV